MEFTEQEISTMKGLSDPETIALLKKIFIDMPSANFAELKKNIVALDNEKYGELMKIQYFTEKDNKSRIEFIVKATKQRDEKKTRPHAPR